GNYLIRRPSPSTISRSSRRRSRSARCKPRRARTHNQGGSMWAVTVGDFRAGPREREYVNQVLDSGRLSYGPFCRKFEEEFARAHGCKHAVFCNSGTSALHLAVAALKERHGWADGDEVIVPSVTFVATANVVLHNNLRPVFVDVDPLT